MSSSSESDGEDETYGLEPYMFEPNLSKETYSYNQDVSSSEESDGSEMNEATRNSRLESSTWCKCTKCKCMATEKESVCCKEIEALCNERFDGEKCITDTEEFKIVCLNTAVIRTSLISMKNYGDANIEPTFNNKNMRFGCYKQFTFWAHNRLGKGKRVPLPSCVVMSIRNSFPSTDGLYEGFKDSL